MTEVGFKDSHSQIVSPSTFLVLQTSAFQLPESTWAIHLVEVFVGNYLADGNFIFILDVIFLVWSVAFLTVNLGSTA